MKQFMQINGNEWSQDKQLEMELATATASILPENSEDNTVNIFCLFKNLDFCFFSLVTEKWSCKKCEWV